MFFCCNFEQNLLYLHVVFCANIKKHSYFYKNYLTNCKLSALIYLIYLPFTFKDNDGKYVNIQGFRESAFGASRCNGFCRSPSRVGPVKAYASNRTRALPLQSMALIEAEKRFPVWEIIRVVPRKYFVP